MHSPRTLLSPVEPATLERELGALVDSAGSDAAIKTKAPRLLRLAEASGRTGRGLLLASIDQIGQTEGRTSGEDGRRHKYDFAYSAVAEALRQLFGNDAAQKTLTERREGVAQKIGTGSSAQTGKRNTDRLLVLLASAILEVASSPKKKGQPTPLGQVNQDQTGEYERLRGAGRWLRTWGADAEVNASLVREALVLLCSVLDPQSAARAPLASELDSRVLLAPAPLEVGGIEIEILAEVEGGRAFEEARRLRELDELAPRSRTGLALRLVPSSVCPPPSGDVGFLDFVRRYGVLVAPLELDQLVRGDVALEDLVALKLFRGLAEGRPPRDFAVDTPTVDVAGVGASVLRPALRVLEELPISDSPIRHPQLDDAAARLRADQHVLIT